jgi:hypothetical protein
MRFRLLSLASLLVPLVGSAAWAVADFETSPLPPGQVVTTALRLDALSITQNGEPGVIESGAVACADTGVTTDNWFGRVYDLDGDHGLTGQFCVSSLDYAVELVTDPTSTTFQVSCLEQGTAGSHSLSLADLDAGEVFSVTLDTGPAEMEFLNQPLGGCCVAEESDLAVFVITEDCLESGSCGGYFAGQNQLGQIRDWYLAAPDCTIVDPVSSQAIGFAPFLVQVVNGEGTLPDGDVPAIGPAGVALTVLLLLGCSAYFLQRRSRPGALN